jgi:hypothetical protein
MAKKAAQQEPEIRLDVLTLARKEGWQRFVNTPARIPPESLTRPELEALSEDAFDDYNRQRREWHANLGPIKTPQLAALHEDLWGHRQLIWECLWCSRFWAGLCGT